ncbi:hypothetical protein E8E13_000442 [Curvularia kusanoi]|uniref:Uncharacterized protein n=1 Tax=Curvularia kusanoi TaxID=90978 RepID=A0A9P4T5S3_CURKU|nr:hypothetical protein E8E13_000442 [Curvularia kusanoi]
MSLDAIRSQLTADDFSASIDEAHTSLPSSITLIWARGGSNASTLHTIISTVSGNLTHLALHRGNLTDPPAQREDALTQDDADTLASLLAAAPKLTKLELGFAGYAPDSVTYAPSLEGTQATTADIPAAGATPLVYPSTFAKSIGNLVSFIATGQVDFVLPVILGSLDGTKLTELALGDTVVPSSAELEKLAAETGKLQRLYLAANVDTAAAKKLVDANKGLKETRVYVLD